jgi:glycosyltransferase involved in cell wall biosynthesis
MSIPASVYIVTLNCEPWLQGVLESVRDFAEVVILDSGSTDRTWEIAQAFPNVRIRHQDWQGYSGQKALALAECRQPWVLNLDGDEQLSPELKAEIIKTIARDRLDALSTPIRDVFMGKLNHPWARNNAKVRFFRRSCGRYDLSIAVHEAVSITGRVGNARGAILHYGDEGIAGKVAKINSYSGLKSQEKDERGKRVNPLKLLLVMPLTFFKSYIGRRNFLNGWRGFIGSTINAFYAFLKEAKLYERSLDDKDSGDQP